VHFRAATRYFSPHVPPPPADAHHEDNKKIEAQLALIDRCTPREAP